MERGEGLADAGEIEVGRVSDSVGSLLTRGVEFEEGVVGCSVCDCDVTEVRSDGGGL